MNARTARTAARSARRRSRGVGALSLALTLPVFLVSAGLAVDVARMTHARNDLQVALDAASLAACRAIYDSDTSKAKIENSARDVAELNALQGTDSKDGKGAKIKSKDIELGIYDFETASFSEAPKPLDLSQVNSVRITASLSDAANPVTAVLAGVAGVEAFDPTLSATAVLGAPSKAKAIFPMVVDEDLFDGIPPGIPSPVALVMSPGSNDAAWSGFFGATSAAAVRDLIQQFVNDPFSTPEVNANDIVTASNGTMTTCYDEAQSLLPPGTNFTVLVVKKTGGWSDPKVVGFASFTVISITTGGSKAITGELIKHSTEYTGETISKCFGLECRHFLVDGGNHDHATERASTDRSHIGRARGGPSGRRAARRVADGRAPPPARP